MQQTPPAGTAEAPNGSIVPGNSGKGIRDIVDGTSKTLVAAETKNQVLPSWYGGTCSWVVACPTTQPALSNNPQPIRTTATNNFWTTGGTGGVTSLNVGPRPDQTVRYFHQAQLLTGKIWDWGPSSDHTGGVILHLIGDASARSLTDDIDVTLYYQLVTRAGREPVSLPEN
jgi:hypothetical protein